MSDEVVEIELGQRLKAKACDKIVTFQLCCIELPLDDGMRIKLEGNQLTVTEEKSWRPCTQDEVFKYLRENRTVKTLDASWQSVMINHQGVIRYQCTYDGANVTITEDRQWKVWR